MKGDRPPEQAIFEHQLIDSFMDKYLDLPLTIYLSKAYFVLLAQFVIILLFTWYGFDTEINMDFINGNAPIAVVVVTTYAITGLTFGAFGIVTSCPTNNQFLYIYFFVYCLLITFYMNLLTLFADKIYIIFTLAMIVLDIIAMELYIIIFNYYCLFGIAISQVIISIIATPIFAKFIEEGMRILTRLIIINISIIYYFEMMTFFSVHYVEHLEIHFAAVLIFNYGIFAPVAIIVAIGTAILLYGIGNSDSDSY